MRAHRFSAAGFSGRQHLMLLTGCLLALFLIYHTYLYAPVQQRIADLRRQIRSVRLESGSQSHSRALLTKLERQLATIRKDLEQVTGEIAYASEGSLLLEEIADVARAAGLTIAGFRPAEEKQRGRYATRPFALDLDGEFTDLIWFLSALKHTPRLNKLGNMVVTSTATENHQAPLKISLEILTYRMPNSEQGLPPARAVNPVQVVIPSRPGDAPRLRDPFRPMETPGCDPVPGGLQYYDLDALELVGIFWEPQEPKGLVMDVVESAHIVVVGSRIGNRGGIVKAITPTQVIVQETLPDGATIPRAMSVEFLGSLSAPNKDSAQEMSEPGERGRGSGGHQSVGRKERSRVGSCAANELATRPDATTTVALPKGTQR